MYNGVNHVHKYVNEIVFTSILFLTLFPAVDTAYIFPSNIISFPCH